MKKTFLKEDFKDNRKVEMLLNGERIDNKTNDVKLYFNIPVIIKWDVEQFYIKIEVGKDLTFKSNQIKNFNFNVDGISFIGYDEYNDITFHINLS